GFLMALEITPVRAAPEPNPPDKVIHPLMGPIKPPELVPEGKKNPVYPDRWRSRKLGARVVLQGEIDKWGMAKKLQVLKTDLYVENDCGKNSGEEEKEGPEAKAPPEAARDFESAALTAVKQWKFRPGTNN